MKIKLSKLFRGKRGRRMVAVVGMAVVAVAAIVVATAEQKLSHLVLGGLGEGFSTRVFSEAMLVSSNLNRPAVHPSPETLMKKLKRLNYRRTYRAPVKPGEFNWSDPRLTVYVRAFQLPFASQESGIFLFSFTPDRTWQISGPHGQTVEDVFLEPELIAELSGEQKVRRSPAAWDEIPTYLADAVVAIEDARFYHHFGINPRSILRALVNNAHGRAIQGGSTITQQLAKNLFLSPKRTLRRKISEALLAVYLEIRFSKEKILTLYLNHIYMGQDGYISVAGVKSAADFYFHKNLEDIDLAEAALLAGIIRSPYRYNPFKTPEVAKKRRDIVLAQMLKQGFIGRAEFKSATAEPVKVVANNDRIKDRTIYDYFISELLRQLLPHHGEEMVYRSGLSVYTTIDPDLQMAAVAATHQSQYQVALVALYPQNGAVAAMIGGKDFKESQFNRATQAIRQPGSAFKPFVYGAALEKNYTAASILNDAPRTFIDEKGKRWKPKNFDGFFYGKIPLRQAISLSLNGATVYLADKIGGQTIVDFAGRLGIDSPLGHSLALALGAYEVTLLELTRAYAPFANGGFRVKPLMIHTVLDSDGQVIELNSQERTSVIDPRLAYVVTSLLQSTVAEGTARSLAMFGWLYASAGKTGTTNQGKDAWFIGYTPELLAGVWIGRDDAVPLQITGAGSALPIWAAFMRRAFSGVTPANFEKPADIVTARIDPMSGLLARSGCPDTHDEIFIPGTQPNEACPLHPGGLHGLLKKFFGGR